MSAGKKATWTPEEDAILLRPITARQARAELARAGYELRNDRAISRRRLMDLDMDPDTRLVRTMLIITRAKLEGGQHRRNNESPEITEALKLGLIRKKGKSTYLPRLKGVAWLTEKLGDWEAELEPPSEDLEAA